MKNHLKVHSIFLNLTKDQDTNDDEPSERKRKLSGQQKLIVQFTKNYLKTLPEILASLIAIDGLSLNVVVNSQFIRESISERGLNLPKSPSLSSQFC